MAYSRHVYDIASSTSKEFGHAFEEKAAEAAQREQEEQQAAQEQQTAEPTEDNLTDEERQAMEQWLRRVPDDPGGLLRNKFNYEYYKRNQDIMNGDWAPPENGAENRW